MAWELKLVQVQGDGTDKSAKNIVLMGVASLSIHDSQPVTLSDLSSQVFLGALLSVTP
jgi:molybdopterin/thiamine biosynthesis adenylyltransferase